MITNQLNSQSLKELPPNLEAQPKIELWLADEWSLISEETFLENMRQMATRFQKNGGFPKRLSIMSALSGEGVTAVCLGIGVTLANDYQERTCIVDLNWYSPSKLFQNDDERPGIAGVLDKKVQLQDAIQSSGLKALDILPAGKLDDYKRPIIARNNSLDQIFEELDQQYARIILDIPAILSTSDAVHLAAYGRSGCFVIRHGVTSIQDVKLALDDVINVEIKGVVINRVSLTTPAKLVNLLY